jgi:hypothetical protein
MKDRNLTLGQLRFIWRNFLEARALLAAGFVGGVVVGRLLG